LKASASYFDMVENQNYGILLIMMRGVLLFSHKQMKEVCGIEKTIILADVFPLARISMSDLLMNELSDYMIKAPTTRSA
jgi:hypothetical protein